MKGDKRMRKMKRMISAFLVIMLVAGCLMGCGGSEKKEETGSGEPKNGGTLVVGISQDPQSFNPNAKFDSIFNTDTKITTNAMPFSPSFVDAPPR